MVCFAKWVFDGGVRKFFEKRREEVTLIFRFCKCDFEGLRRKMRERKKDEERLKPNENENS